MAIRGAFLAIFDQVAGRKIAHQTPEGFIGAEEFDAIAEYVIPKPQLCGQLVCLAAFETTVMGFPMCIEAPKYPRNALLFNLCFVLDEVGAEEEEAQGAVLKKLARALRTLEVEAAHLSDVTRRSELALLLPRLVRELNSARQCTLVVDSANTMRLRLLPSARDQLVAVRAHDVPVLVAMPGRDMLAADLALRCVLPHIDGSMHACAIAVASGCDLGWVLDVLTDLAGLGCVVLADCFSALAVYAPTARLSELVRNESAQAACVQHSRRAGRPAPAFQAVFALYWRTSPRADGSWASVADVCAAVGDDALRDIDVGRCMQFGVINGYLRRVHAYPRHEPQAQLELEAENGGPSLASGLPSELLDGCHSAEEIACSVGCTYAELRATLDGECTWVMRLEPEQMGLIDSNR